MKHYFNVCDINGAEVEPVDLITFGSPCQDLSVAGKRAGLDGARSGLFVEAVRIIKEMRKNDKRNGRADDLIRPRFAVWENVPGAFSSQKGEDFRTVLEELAKVADESIHIPGPPKGKWLNAGAIVGNGFSIAWRVLDAQYWGVPQRRRRIFLVADFARQCAEEVLFKSESVSGYSAEGFRSWQRTACRAKTGIGATGFDGYNGDLTDDVSATLGVNCGMSTGRNGVVLNDQGGNRMDVTDEVTSTLRAEAHHPPCVMESAGFCTDQSAKSRSIGFEEEKSPTLRAGVVPAVVAVENHPTDGRCKIETDGKVQTLTSRMGTGGMNVPLVLKIRSGCEGGGKGALIQENKSATLGCNNNQTLFEPCTWDGNQTAPTLTANNAGGNQRMPDKDNFNCILQPFGIRSDGSNSMKSDNPHSGIYEAETARTVDTSGGNPSCNQGGIAVVESYSLQGSMIGRKDKNGPNGDGINEDVSFTLNTTDRHAVYAMTTGSFTQVEQEKSPTLMARDFKAPNAVCYGIGRDAFNQGQNAKYQPSFEKDLQPTLVAKGPGAIQSGYTVRRLTPTECARLQGFCDSWGELTHITDMSDDDVEFWNKCRTVYAKINGKKYKEQSKQQLIKWYNKLHTDSAEYKMYGNGMALPCVRVPIHGLAKCGAKTMASLFDGSGGFPLAGLRDGIKTLWVSEIEPYPIAVTKERFKEL